MVDGSTQEQQPVEPAPPPYDLVGRKRADGRPAPVEDPVALAASSAASTRVTSLAVSSSGSSISAGSGSPP